jgi:hypothetical protein
LDVASNELTGMMPVSLLTSATVIIARNNKLTSLPASLGSPSVQPALVYFDLRDNLMTGALPSWLSSLPTLQLIDVTNNPQLACTGTDSECVSGAAFVRFDTGASTTIMNDTLLCSRLKASTSATLRVDPSYLSYRQCACAAGWMQASIAVPPTCIPCPADCQCEAGRVIGCYPLPESGNWTTAEACAPIGGSLETACNPFHSSAVLSASQLNQTAGLFACSEVCADFVLFDFESLESLMGVVCRVTRAAFAPSVRPVTSAPVGRVRPAVRRCLSCCRFSTWCCWR